MTSNIQRAIPSVFHGGPFPHTDIFFHGSQYLLIADMANCAKVNKSWNAYMHSNALCSFWSKMYDDEKIPPIEDHDDKTIMKDYLFMSPRTWGARKMACLGGFVGEVPKISAEAFNKLQTEMDPYEPKKELSETFVIVVEPVYIYRPYDKALFDKLVWLGDFNQYAPENQNVEEKGLFIPYSLKNLKILAEHPLYKKGKGPIFKDFDDYVRRKCNTIAKTARVTVMRIQIPKKSQGKGYKALNEFLQKDGYQILPLLTRLYFDTVEILNKDACPDKEGTRSACSDKTSTGDVLIYSAEIGDFTPDAGLSVNSIFANDGMDWRGAVPGFPGEVQSWLSRIFNSFKL